MRSRKTLEVYSLISLMFMWAIALIYLPSLPTEIPTHFNFSGKPDGWSAKHFIFFLPAISTVLYFGLSLIPRYPHLINFPVEITEQNKAKQLELSLSVLSLIKLEMLLSFAYITWVQIQVALEKMSSLGFLFLIVFVITVAMTLVSYFRKAKSLA